MVVVVAIVIVNDVSRNVPDDVAEGFYTGRPSVEIQSFAHGPEVGARLMAKIVNHFLPVSPDIGEKINAACEKCVCGYE